VAAFPGRPRYGAHLGIDFGTSNTAAVLRTADGRRLPLLFDGSPLLPSAVFAAEDGRLAVGRDALHLARSAPERFEPAPKRCIDDGQLLLGDREHAVTDVIAAVLARVLDEARRTLDGETPPVTITHPAAWGPTRRDLVAGIKLVPIVAKTPEGTAGGVTTADMKTNATGGTGEAKVVKASAEQPSEGAAAPAPKAAPLPDPLTLPEAKFLRHVHRGACDEFTTVLGPEANDVHRTHLHLDLQDRHALNVCQ